MPPSSKFVEWSMNFKTSRIIRKTRILRRSNNRRCISARSSIYSRQWLPPRWNNRLRRTRIWSLRTTFTLRITRRSSLRNCQSQKQSSVSTIVLEVTHSSDTIYGSLTMKPGWLHQESATSFTTTWRERTQYSSRGMAEVSDQYRCTLGGSSTQ
jgi:hypothetical protein